MKHELTMSTFFDGRISKKNRSHRTPKKKLCLNNIKYIDMDGVYHITTKIDNLEDLIHLAETYIPGKQYNINLQRIHKIRHELIQLNAMVGLTNIKKSIIDNVIFFVQNLQDRANDMIHIVIQGPPGVGKTMLGQLLGNIYHKLGVIEPPQGHDIPLNNTRNNTLNNSMDNVNKFKSTKTTKSTKSTNLTLKLNLNSNFDFGSNSNSNSNSNYHSNPEQQTCKFRCVKRSDLIGKYLGWTAEKTQAVIDSCIGGVMFIDEAYALGNSQKTDSFSKECIDTINQNLTERKNQFLCIVAGYKDDLDACFFSYNPGLKRRFPFVYTIDAYNADELAQIFVSMIKNDGSQWTITDQESRKDAFHQFFQDNLGSFKNMAGDMETLFFYTKLAHSRRIFGLNSEHRHIITLEDIIHGFTMFKTNREPLMNGGNPEVSPESLAYMYV
jgi:SpoVK/Ycf46/Vps4 family AAA+-type ATPase